ncbi:toll-like receptor 13 [Fundulus diaphanus]
MKNTLFCSKRNIILPATEKAHQYVDIGSFFAFHRLPASHLLAWRVKMGLEDDKPKPRGESSFSKCSITFLMIYMICVSPPASGFSLRSCRVSQNAALCMDSQLKVVPQDIPPTVTGFDLSKNKISSIQASNFKNLLGRHNQYSVITEDVIKSLPSLMYVDFKYNSFYCDCDNAWFLNWTIASKQTQVNDAYNYSCNYPDEFKGKKLLDFDLISCLEDVGFICFVSTTCVILFVIAGSFTYHFMRAQLYCAYYLFWAWLFDSKYKNKQVPHQYDAFVSYNFNDEPWVIGELLPKLEGEQGWRLCLHHRDFEPGKPIADNITDAIYGSRKTICVISRRYLESEWCSREVQTASFRLFDEKRDVLILVFLEDIPTYLLSPFHRMRKLLKKQTYLSWPRAAAQPEVFWEKLKQALQSGSNPNEDNFLSLTDTQE